MLSNNNYHTACKQFTSTKPPVFSPCLENNHSIIHTTRLIYHLSIYLLQFYRSHPSHKLLHNVTATLTIQGNRIKSTINALNGSTQTSHSVRYCNIILRLKQHIKTLFSTLQNLIRASKLYS